MTPWPACEHGDDPTICPQCWAELAPLLEAETSRRRRLARWLKVRWWLLRDSWRQPDAPF